MTPNLQVLVKGFIQRVKVFARKIRRQLIQHENQEGTQQRETELARGQSGFAMSSKLVFPIMYLGKGRRERKREKRERERKRTEKRNLSAVDSLSNRWGWDRLKLQPQTQLISLIMVSGAQGLDHSLLSQVCMKLESGGDLEFKPRHSDMGVGYSNW